MTSHEMGVQTPLRQPQRISRAQLNRRMSELESENEMSSLEFLKLWRAGDLPENPEFVEWYRLSAILASSG